MLRINVDTINALLGFCEIQKMSKNKYGKKLLDPKWQKRRLEIFQRDNWKCLACSEDKKTLHIHHLWYEYNKEPWDYPSDALVTLCFNCHDNITANPEITFDKLHLNQNQISKVLKQIEKISFSKTKNTSVSERKIQKKSTFKQEKVSNWEELKKTRPRAGKVWTLEEDTNLLSEFEQGFSLDKIAELRQRGVFSVAVRLCKLGKNPTYP